MVDDIGLDNAFQSQLNAGVMFESADVLIDHNLIAQQFAIGIEANQCAGGSNRNAEIFFIGVIDDDL